MAIEVLVQAVCIHVVKERHFVLILTIEFNRSNRYLECSSCVRCGAENTLELLSHRLWRVKASEAA
jgi:hypothetical protein